MSVTAYCFEGVYFVRHVVYELVVLRLQHLTSLVRRHGRNRRVCARQEKGDKEGVREKMLE